MSTPVLRIGVLGCANIARAFIRDVADSPLVQVVAVASRSAEKAAAFARETGVPRSHGRYEDLLADPALDAIYLPLPNSLHAEWAQHAAAAGKHVLCEKPLALNRAQAQAMFEAAARHGVLLLEAYPYWFQPQTGALVQLLASGRIGAPRSVQASFGFRLPVPATPDAAVNIRLQAELGGGALLDAGSYPMSLIRLVMGDAPQRVWAHATWAAGGVDLSTAATLVWDDGRRAQLSCAMDGGVHRRAVIVGEHGCIETEFLNHTHTGTSPHRWGFQPSQLRVRANVPGQPPALAFDDVACGTGSGFRFAAEAFADLVARGDRAAAARAAAASVDIAAALDAMAASARSGAVTAV